MRRTYLSGDSVNICPVVVSIITEIVTVDGVGWTVGGGQRMWP